MNDLLEILRAAADEGLPDSIDKSSAVSNTLVRELVDAGLLDATDVSTHHGGPAYLGARITVRGREYLQKPQTVTPPASGRLPVQRGIKINGSALRTLRQQKALTQAELAQRADVSMLTVSKAERGSPVDPSTLKKLADAVDSPVQALHSAEIDDSIVYQSIFISYGGPDEPFAKLLNDRFKATGLKTFFFPDSAIPGEKLHRTMSQGVQEYDRVLLICSEPSLGRSGLLNELEHVLAREAEAGGDNIIVPITRDDYIFARWKPEKTDLARQLRARFILSFEGATEPGPEFDARFGRLLGALETRQIGTS